MTEISISDANFAGNFVSGNDNSSQHADQARPIDEDSDIMADQVTDADVIDPELIEDWEKGDLEYWDEQLSIVQDYFEVVSEDPAEGNNHLKFNVYPGRDKNGSLVSQGGIMVSYMLHDQHVRVRETASLQFRFRFNNIDSQSIGSLYGFTIQLPMASVGDEMYPNPTEAEFDHHSVEVLAKEESSDPDDGYKMDLTVSTNAGNTATDTTQAFALPVASIGGTTTTTVYRELWIDYTDTELKAEIRKDGSTLASVSANHDNKLRSGGIAIEGEVQGLGGGSSDYDVFIDDFKKIVTTGS